MNHYLKIFSGICVFFFYSQNIYAQEPYASAKLQNQNIMIGDQVRVFVETHHQPENETLTWAIPKDTLNTLELVAQSKIDSSFNNGILIQKQTLTVTGWDSGQHVIPPFTFKVVPKSGTAFSLNTDTLKLNVGIPVVDTAQPFKDIKNLEEVPAALSDYWPWVLGILGVLILTALIIFWVKKRKKHAKPIAPENKETYWERSLRLCQELNEAQLWQKGQVKDYYSSLSDILRQYLEKRFDIQAMEKTTGEIVKQTKKINAVKPFRKELRHLLDTSDLAKFAKAKPTDDEHVEALNMLTLFVKQTKPPAEDAAVSLKNKNS